MCGVFDERMARGPMSSQRMSSTSTMTMFGRRGGAGGGEEPCCLWSGAPHVIVTRAARRTSSFRAFIAIAIAARCCSQPLESAGRHRPAKGSALRRGAWRRRGRWRRTRVRSVAFLERRARITRCDALGLCSRERDESAAQGLNASLEESFRDRVAAQYTYRAAPGAARCERRPFRCHPSRRVARSIGRI